MQEEYSVAVWVKPLGNHYHYNGTIFSSGDWNKTCYSFGLSQDNSQVDILCKGHNNYLTCAVPINTWTHLICTCDSNNIVRLYKNGEYINFSARNDKPDSDNANQAAIGRETYANGYFTFNGMLNDFRLYDHCLSPFEVKQISQGLILHYPLNRNGFGVDNILVNTHFDSRYTQSTGWDTTKNGTQLASSWGGYNGGVSNSSTVYHAHLKEFNGEWVYEYIKTANENWLGISQSGLQSKLTAGKTYTFSWEEYHVDGTNRVSTGLYYYKTGATSANFHLGIREAAEVIREIGRWQKYTYTFTAPSDADWSKNMTWYIYGHYNGNGTFYVRHIKLEEGPVATPWCPNSADALATTMGLNDNVEYDTSGYGNNGMRTGTFSWTSDTPKYSVSTAFEKGIISIPNSFVTTTDPIFSVSLWFKLKSGITYTAYTDLISFSSSSYSNQPFRLELCGTPVGKSIMWFRGPSGQSGGFAVKSDISTDEWYHTVLVSEGNKQYSYYVNGEKLGTYNGSANSWTPTGNIFLGENINGVFYESDFRIYMTALSTDDVKSLYNNSAYIDNQGNIYGALYEEV